MLWNVLGSEASASRASFPPNLGKLWASSCLLSSLGLLPPAPHPSLPWLWLWFPTSCPWSDPRELSHNKGGQRYRVSAQGAEKGEPGLKQVGRVPGLPIFLLTDSESCFHDCKRLHSPWLREGKAELLGATVAMFLQAWGQASLEQKESRLLWLHGHERELYVFLKSRGLKKWISGPDLPGQLASWLAE